MIAIENGTVGEVVLDCPYSADDDDLNSVVIMWYHDDAETPVSQWIPEGQIEKPQVQLTRLEVQ